MRERGRNLTAEVDRASTKPRRSEKKGRDRTGISLVQAIFRRWGTLPHCASPTLCHEHSVAEVDPVRPYPRDTGFFLPEFAGVMSAPLLRLQTHSFDTKNRAITPATVCLRTGIATRNAAYGAEYEEALQQALSACFGQGFLNHGRRIGGGAVQIPVHRTLVACESGEFELASLGHYRDIHGSVKAGSRCDGALPDQFQQAEVAQMAENVRASCPRNLTILSSPERFEYGFV
jgi:hypothetical protein